MKEVLISFQSREECDPAFVFALRLAETFNSELLIVEVTRLADCEKVLDSGAGDGREDLRRFCDQAKGVSCSHRISVGRFAFAFAFGAALALLALFAFQFVPHLEPTKEAG